MSMARRAARGTIWISGGTLVVKVGVIAQQVLLARVLSVEEFGVAAMVLVAIMLQSIVGTLGFMPALIQQRESPSTSQLNTAWTLDCFLPRMLQAVVVALLGSPAAVFFQMPDLAIYIPVVALISVVQAFENVAAVVLARQLELKRRSLLTLSFGTGFAVSSIPLILMLQSPWAIVWSALIGRLLRTLVSHFIVSHQLRLQFVWSDVRGNLPFAGWVFVVQVIKKLKGNLDRIIVGRIFGAEMLGLYHLASRMSVQSIRDVLNASAQTLFPAAARFQNDPAKLQPIFLAVLECVIAGVGVVMGALFLLAEPVVATLVGEKWRFATQPLQIACLAALLTSISFLILPIARGLGAPETEASGQAIGVTTFAIIALQPFWLDGWRLLFVALFVSEFLMCTYLLHRLARLLECSALALLKVLFRAIGIALAGVGCAYGVITVMPAVSETVTALVLAPALVLIGGAWLVLAVRMGALPGGMVLWHMYRGTRPKAPQSSAA